MPEANTGSIQLKTNPEDCDSSDIWFIKEYLKNEKQSMLDTYNHSSQASEFISKNIKIARRDKEKINQNTKMINMLHD